MIAKTKIQITREYRGSSKFSFWPNIEIGDIIRIEIPFVKQSRGRNGLYGQTITLINERNGEKYICSINDGCNYLSKMEYKEL